MFYEIFKKFLRNYTAIQNTATIITKYTNGEMSVFLIDSFI